MHAQLPGKGTGTYIKQLRERMQIMEKGYLVTVDINKAFDTIEREALFEILHARLGQ